MTRDEMHGKIVDILCSEWGPEGPEGRATAIIDMIDGEWTPFDYENREANPLPPPDDYVWIHDEFYHGVTVGMRGYGTAWQTAQGSDDISVTHWKSMDVPDKPRVGQAEGEGS